MRELILVVLFVVSAIVGYKIIKHVPGLLHTPLLSGMNALSGIPILGALVAASAAVAAGSRALAMAAVFIASINIVGGFGITNKMLKMFRKEKK